MKKFLGIAIISVIVAGAFVTTDAVGSAIDLMALIFVLGIGIGHSMSARANESAITRFGDGCVRAGWLGLLVGLVIMTSTLEPTLDAMLRYCCCFTYAALWLLFQNPCNATGLKV